ncbi:MAG: hypothetical protein ACRDV9_06755 [Acidimicrobiia bacterium]
MPNPGNGPPLAELDVRHTLRHMPVRRVALGHSRLPATGSFGAALLACVVSANVGDLERAQRSELPALLRDAANGLSVPRLALRHRLQVDIQGLSRSRHRLIGEGVGLVVELDVHAHHPAPQVLGAVMAAAAMPLFPRRLALVAIERAIGRPGAVPEGITVRRLSEASERVLFTPRGGDWGIGNGRATSGTHHPDVNGSSRASGGQLWIASAEGLWALDVLRLSPSGAPGRQDVQRQFRMLVRLAHPDHGATAKGAAERMAELGEARRLLLEHLDG